VPTTPSPPPGLSSKTPRARSLIRSGPHWQLTALAVQTPAVAQLITIPGIGLLTATALVAFVGDIRRFPSARHFASYLGLTPRENSSGLRRRLGAISKRGDVYLRTLLIHGAHSVLHAAKRKTLDRLRAWDLAREAARGHNKAATALANKLARILWAVWKHDRPFLSVPNAA
jgi:transposase